MTGYKQMMGITKAYRKAECKAAELCRARVCIIVYVDCVYIYYIGINSYSEKKRLSCTGY